MCATVGSVVRSEGRHALGPGVRLIGLAVELEASGVSWVHSRGRELTNDVGPPTRSPRVKSHFGGPGMPSKLLG